MLLRGGVYQNNRILHRKIQSEKLAFNEFIMSPATCLFDILIKTTELPRTYEATTPKLHLSRDKIIEND